MIKGQCITTRALPPKDGKKPLHILQILVETKNGPQVVDVFSDTAGVPGKHYQLLPEVYMGKLSLALGGMTQ